MRKRLRIDRSICSCKSPRLTHQSRPRSSFNWFEEDLWTEIAKFMDGKSLVNLAATCRWFRSVIMEDSIWRFVCLRDLQVPAPRHVSFKWNNLYTSVANGSHSYCFREQKKHIDWMRIGAFFFDSKVALLTERPSLPVKLREQDTVEKMLETCGACVLGNIKTGIWIADLQLLRCPVCELDTCDGEKQVTFLVGEKISNHEFPLKINIDDGVVYVDVLPTMLDTRHIELFLSEGYQDGSWEYELIGSYNVEKPVAAAAGGIFDVKHLKDSATSGVFDLKLWTGKPEDCQPKAMITYHTVAISTNLQVNEGIHTKYYTMRAGSEGEIVSIRISQQLL